MKFCLFCFSDSRDLTGLAGWLLNIRRRERTVWSWGWPQTESINNHLSIRILASRDWRYWSSCAASPGRGWLWGSGTPGGWRDWDHNGDSLSRVTTPEASSPTSPESPPPPALPCSLGRTTAGVLLQCLPSPLTLTTWTTGQSDSDYNVPLNTTLRFSSNETLSPGGFEYSKNCYRCYSVELKCPNIISWLMFVSFIISVVWRAAPASGGRPVGLLRGGTSTNMSESTGASTSHPASHLELRGHQHLYVFYYKTRLSPYTFSSTLALLFQRLDLRVTSLCYKNYGRAWWSARWGR